MITVGGSAFLWSLTCFALIYNSPSTHPRISAQEKNYIISSIGVDENNGKVNYLKICIFYAWHVAMLNSILYVFLILRLFALLPPHFVNSPKAESFEVIHLVRSQI